MGRQTQAMFLDSAPRMWSVKGKFHFQLSRALIARGGRMVLVFSEPLPERMPTRFLECAVQVEAINYRKSEIAYVPGLRRRIHDNAITAIHISLINYFDLLPWWPT